MNRRADRHTRGIAAGLPNQVVHYRDGGEDYALGRGPTLAHLGALDKAYETVTQGHRRAQGSK